MLTKGFEQLMMPKEKDEQMLAAIKISIGTKEDNKAKALTSPEKIPALFRKATAHKLLPIVMDALHYDNLTCENGIVSQYQRSVRIQVAQQTQRGMEFL